MTLKIGCFSDTHEQHRRVKIERCDILVFAGDLTGRGGKHQTLDFIDWLEQQHQATYKVFVAGNHDFDFERKPDWLVDRLNHLNNNTHYLEDTGMEIMGLRVWGSPWQPWFFDWAFNLQRGTELAAKWARIPYEVDLLVTHGPPYGIDDLIPEAFRQPGQADLHVGDEDLLNAIRVRKIATHVFGHIHIDNRKEIIPVIRTMDGQYNNATRHINACLVDNKYKMIVKPFYFEIRPHGSL